MDDLADRLLTVTRDFPLALDLGGHTGRLAAALGANPRIGRVIRADLFTRDRTAPGCDLVVDDAFPPFADASLDLVASALSLHLVNDLPGALIQIRRMLKPDGLFLATLAGGDTLFELRDSLMRAELEVTGGAAPRVAPFADTRSLGALLQRAGFALPVADTDRVTVRYADLFGLVRDLRAMGATNHACRAIQDTARSCGHRSRRRYLRKRTCGSGRTPARHLRPCFTVGLGTTRKPAEAHEAGTAKVSLADALKAFDAPGAAGDSERE